MPRFEKAETFIKELASEVLCEFASHKPVLDNKVTIDYLFAYGDKDDSGCITTPAITHNGVQALGMCKIIGYKDRVKGMADVEIQLDADWWLSHDRGEQKALLDHELNHIQIIEESPGKAKRDHADRPKLKCRPHDAEFGWFKIVAERHGTHSQERIQARSLVDNYGQSYWPDVFGSAASFEHEAAAKELQKLMLKNNAKMEIRVGAKESEMLVKAAEAMEAKGD